MNENKNAKKRDKVKIEIEPQAGFEPTSSKVAFS